MSLPSSRSENTAFLEAICSRESLARSGFSRHSRLAWVLRTRWPSKAGHCQSPIQLSRTLCVIETGKVPPPLLTLHLQELLNHLTRLHNPFAISKCFIWNFQVFQLPPLSFSIDHFSSMSHLNSKLEIDLVTNSKNLLLNAKSTDVVQLKHDSIQAVDKWSWAHNLIISQR